MWNAKRWAGKEDGEGRVGEGVRRDKSGVGVGAGIDAGVVEVEEDEEGIVEDDAGDPFRIQVRSEMCGSCGGKGRGSF